MFYSQFILAKKGPLGTIWIAAHLERKLRKNQVAETNIGVSVDSILFPDVPIALRLSGHLLLGVVRIYSKKVNYLFNDCSEALLKIKQAFQSTVVDLPPEAATAPFHSITLPETFDFDELELLQDTENTFFQSNGNYVDHHISTREQITLQDPAENTLYLGSSQIGLDERFGDGDCSQIGLDFDEDFLDEKPRSPAPSTPLPMLQEEMAPPMTAYGGDEAIKMDIDVYDQPSTSSFASERIVVDEQMDIDTHHPASTGELHTAIMYESGAIDAQHRLTTSIIGSQRINDDQQMKEPGAIDANHQPTASIFGSQRIIGDQQVHEQGTIDAHCKPTESITGSQRIQLVTNAIAPDNHHQINGHHQDLHAQYYSSSRANTGEQGFTNDLGTDRVQGDGHQNVPSLDSLLGPLNQVTNAKISSKAPEFYAHKNDEPMVAKPNYPPPIFEARTPDLNQEFCPPDEPSTPALPEEATLVMHKQSVLSPDKEKCLPLPLSPERFKTSDSLQDFLQSNQFSVPSPLVPTETTFPAAIQQQSPPFSGQDQQLDAGACYQQAGLQTQAPHVPKFSSFLSQGNASVSASSSLSQGSAMVSASSLFPPGQRHTSSEAVKGSTVHQDLPIEPALSAVDDTGHGGFTPFQGFPSCSGPMSSNSSPSLGQIQKEPSTHFPALESTNRQPAGGVPPVEVLPPILSPSRSSQNAVSSMASMVHPVQQGSMAAVTQTSAPPFQGFPQPVQEFTGVSSSSSGSTPDFSTSQNLLLNTSSGTSSHQWPIHPRPDQEPSLLFQTPAFISNQKSSQPIVSTDQLGGVNHVQSSSLGTTTSSSLPERPAILQGQAQPTMSSSSLLQQSAAMQGRAQSSSFGTMDPPSKLQQLSVVQQPSSTVDSFVPSAMVQGPAQPSVSSSSLFQQSAMVQSQAQPSVSSSSMFQQSAMVQGQAQPSGSPSSRFQQSAMVQGQAQPSVSFSSRFQQSAMVQGQTQPSVSSSSMFQQSAMVQGQTQPSVSSSSMFQQSAMVQDHPEPSSAGTTMKFPPLFQQPGLQGHLQSPSLGAMNSPSLFPQPASIGALNPSSFFQQPLATQGHTQSPLGMMNPSFLYQQPGAVQGQQFTINEATPKAPLSFPPPSFTSSQPFSTPSKESAQTQRMAMHSEMAHPYSIPSSSTGNEKNQRKVMAHAYEHETLRSYADAQRAERDFLYLRKGASVETIPHLEMDGRNTHIARTNERLEEMMRPKLDIMHTMREETPFTVMKSSPFSNRSFGPIPADDDVLASILGRRGSSFQVIPTPSAKEQPAQKRPRVAPKSIPRKRKFDFDTLTVLHGDVIRQQLANTDDIRRERKKAPCTRREIWRFNKEVQGQQNFSEPSLPELSTSLHDLYHEVLGVDGFKFPSLEIALELKDTPVVEFETGKRDFQNKGNNSVVDNKGNDPMFQNKGDGPMLESKGTDPVVPSFEELLKAGLAVAPPENSCAPANDVSKGAVHQLERSSGLSQTSLAVCFPDASYSRGSIPHPHVAGEPVLQAANKPEEFLVSNLESKDAAIEISKPLSCSNREDIMPSISIFPTAIIETGENLCKIDVQGLQSTDAHSSLSSEREAIKEVPEQAIEQVPEQAIEQVSKQAIEQVFEQANEQVFEQANEQLPEEAIEHVREQAIEQVPEQVSKQVPEPAFEELSGQDSKVGLEQVLEQGSEQAIEKLPEQASEHGLDQAPQQVFVQALGQLLEQDAEQVAKQVILGNTEQPPANYPVICVKPTSDPIDGQESSKTTDAGLQVGEEIAIPVVQVDSRDAGTQVKDPLAGSKIDISCLPFGSTDSMSILEMPASAADLNNGSISTVEKQTSHKLDDEKDNVKEHEIAEQDAGVQEDQKDAEARDAEDDMPYDEVDGFEDSGSDDEYTIQDDSGWSTRTRNVGRYLKTVFEGIGSNAKRSEGDGQPRLGLERLLQRKTKKEAARMFFETLVLKTKDYIHVEQQGAFGDIHLYPNSKLMKTIF